MSELTKERTDKFWSWFIQNEIQLSDNRSADSPILDTLLAQLHEIHPEFFFEIGTNFTPHEFIITAEGKKHLFPLVDELVASAPRIPSWKVIALKQQQGFDFVTDYRGVDYDPKTMWFLPMDGKGNPPSLGLRVGIPNFSEQNVTKAKFSVLIILDTGLGERSAAEDISYVEVVALPSNPADDGYIELVELPKYIRWRKRKTVGTDPSTSSG